jgi:hypothetical protein
MKLSVVASELDELNDRLEIMRLLREANSKISSNQSWGIEAIQLGHGDTNRLAHHRFMVDDSQWGLGPHGFAVSLPEDGDSPDADFCVSAAKSYDEWKKVAIHITDLTNVIMGKGQLVTIHFNVQRSPVSELEFVATISCFEIVA